MLHKAMQNKITLILKDFQYINREVLVINDFAKLLKDLMSEIITGFSSKVSNWDKKSYESVVNCLLLRDEIAVKEAVDHLVAEQKVLAIPPIYLSSQRHPSLIVRKYSWNELGKLDSHQHINQIIANKDLHSALDALIEEYGHFKEDYH